MDSNTQPLPWSGERPPMVAPVETEDLLLTWNKKNSRKNQAAITRNMWEDYKARFIPYENAMMQSVGAHADVLKRTSEGVDNAFSVIDNEHTRNINSYGISVRPEDRAVMQRQMGLQHAASKAGSLNTARGALRDRDLAILGGGLGTLSEQRQQSR